MHSESVGTSDPKHSMSISQRKHIPISEFREFKFLKASLERQFGMLVRPLKRIVLQYSSSGEPLTKVVVTLLLPLHSCPLPCSQLGDRHLQNAFICVLQCEFHAGAALDPAQWKLQKYTDRVGRRRSPFSEASSTEVNLCVP